MPRNFTVYVAKKHGQAIYGSQKIDSHKWQKQLIDSHKWPTVLVDDVKGKPRNFKIIVFYFYNIFLTICI